MDNIMQSIKDSLNLRPRKVDKQYDKHNSKEIHDDQLVDLLTLHTSPNTERSDN